MWSVSEGVLNRRNTFIGAIRVGKTYFMLKYDNFFIATTKPQHLQTFSEYFQKFSRSVRKKLL